MNLRFFVPAIIALSYVSMDARVSIPGVEKIRKKVDAAVQSGSTISLKDLLSKSGHNQSGGVLQGHNVLKALTSNEAADEPDLQKVEDVLNAAYWSCQDDFINNLGTAMAQSQMQAATMLKDKIKEYYKNAKSPLVAFAQELDREEQALKDLVTILFKLMDKKDQRTTSGASFKDLYDRHNRQTVALQQLVSMTNTLIMI